MINLKKFQDLKITELIEKTKLFLNKYDCYQNKLNENKNIIFLEAPTGAGKTIILSMFIKCFFDTFSSKKFNFVFLWFSPGKGNLHIQSKKKIQEVLYTSSYQVMFLEEALTEKFSKNNSVIIINWEKITKKNNRFRQENEKFDLNDFRSKNIKFIAIIDEEHYSKTKKSQEAIDLFQPIITIRTSATLSKQARQLINSPESQLVKINRTDVIQSGLIKKDYLLNPNITNARKLFFNVDDNLGEDAILIKTGLLKQKELKKLFLLENSNVNPLIIVQLADEKDQFIQKKNKQVKKFLQEKEVTFDNGLLAIDLDKEKINLEKLKENTNKVVCIITKQTITQGWDCPRAHILVKLRGRSHKIFNIQTLGRISRIAEINKNYKNDALNSGYVYTLDKTLLQISSPDSVESGLISFPFTLSIKEKYKGVLSLVLKNQKNTLNFIEKANDKLTDNLFNFAKNFNRWWRKHKGIDYQIAASDAKIEINLKEYAQFIPKTKIMLEEGMISGSFYEKDVLNKKIEISYEKDGLSALENNFENYFCLPLAQKLKISYPNIQQILEFLFTSPLNSLNNSNINKKKEEYLYDFKIYGSDFENKEQRVLFYCFFLNSREKWFVEFQKFHNYLNGENIKKNFKDFKKIHLEEFYFHSKKDFLFKVNSEEDYEEKKMPEPNKFLYQGFINPDENNFSKPEIDFIKGILGSYAFSEKIVWWYRNQENKNDSWKIIYSDNADLLRYFYPDFILRINNKIWIMEIKDKNVSDKNSKQKFEYLKAFCDYHNLNAAFVIAGDGNIKINFQKWTNDYKNSKIWLKPEDFFSQID